MCTCETHRLTKQLHETAHTPIIQSTRKSSTICTNPISLRACHPICNFWKHTIWQYALHVCCFISWSISYTRRTRRIIGIITRGQLAQTINSLHAFTNNRCPSNQFASPHNDRTTSRASAAKRTYSCWLVHYDRFATVAIEINYTQHTSVTSHLDVERTSSNR